MIRSFFCIEELFRGYEDCFKKFRGQVHGNYAKYFIQIPFKNKCTYFLLSNIRDFICLN